MRVAWIGGATHGGGVGGYGRVLLQGLLARGTDLTLFSYDPMDQLHDVLGSPANLNIVHDTLQWSWDRWYSRHPLGVFLSSSIQRVRSYKRLVSRLVEGHRRKPFDVVVQFSQTEIFSLARHLHELPPVLLLPCVHAAGELRWHRRESTFALQSEPRWRHYIVRANLMYRTREQRKTLARVYGQIGMSRRFNELMRQDYGVREDRQSVVYQPMPSAPLAHAQRSGGPVKLVYVGRISVRKGIDLLIDLSHRLDDMAGKVELTVIGGPSFWSDYSRNLSRLNPRVAMYVGAKPHQVIMETLAGSDLLLVPSKYEPGGIVVAEALSQGCCVVASDEVGAAEPLSDAACTRFKADDLDAFVQACRAAIERVSADPALARSRALEEASGRFAVEESIGALVRAMENAITETVSPVSSTRSQNG